MHTFLFFFLDKISYFKNSLDKVSLTHEKARNRVKQDVGNQGANEQFWAPGVDTESIDNLSSIGLLSKD